ncbi:SIR2 family protein [Thalassospira xiamenensis]|uniref:SIR2 family protein n=1 Tax=Thalassospira xiamenensis TaxID=220697 RepID=UPI001FFF4D4F|nr:SIR2 family protein [Thalassospira xiamenensis]MCK2165859.1 SIR2 family protein [Thalassospira xiamenensis]
MLIDDFVASLDSQGPRSYYAFETFVQNLLQHHIENQNKEFEFSQSPFDGYDAFAPQGFDEFTGAVAFEIKFNSLHINRPSLFRRLIDKYIETWTRKKFENLIIISAKAVSIGSLREIDSHVGILDLPFSVRVWGPGNLNKIVNKNKKFAIKISDNLFSFRINSAISNVVKDWKASREEVLLDLKSKYDKGQFSILLGAGVSSSAGMPDWNTLLNSLFVNYLTNEFNDDFAVSDEDIGELVSRLNHINEPSALMAARYLRKGLSKRESEAKYFIDEVTKNLYKLRDGEAKDESSLIKSISSMCQPRRTGAKVKSVVTYNFDDLLERQLKKDNILHRSIYTDTESYDPDELPVYHVHGFLPEDRDDYQGLENSTLVFSEEGYHQIYSESFHWSNLVQLNSFRENSCLMIGLSMTDPNLRRLLDISSKNIERSKHFAFMKRLSSDDFCFEVGESGTKKKAVKNVDAAEKFLERHHALNEELMKELGVTIVWYETYDEIPQFITDVVRYES